MMKTIYFVLAVLILSCAFTTGSKADNLKDKIKGKWDVTVPDAPYGYQDYMVDIKEKEKALVADIKGSGVDLKEQLLTEKDGKYTAKVYIEEYITIVIWLENDKIKAIADTSMGNLPCNFVKPQRDK